MKKTIITLGILIAASTQSYARCEIGRMIFRVHENDAHSTTVNTDTNCNISFTNGSALFIESASVLSAPKVGKIERTGELRHRYIKKAGYVGADTLVMKVCGSFQGKSGCSKLTYNFNIQ